MSQPKVLHFAGQARIALQPGMIPLDDDDQRIVNSNWQRIVRNGSQEYDGPLVAIRKAAVVLAQRKEAAKEKARDNDGPSLGW